MKLLLIALLSNPQVYKSEPIDLYIDPCTGEIGNYEYFVKIDADGKLVDMIREKWVFHVDDPRSKYCRRDKKVTRA